MEYTVTYIDGSVENYAIILSKSETHRDAIIKVARKASEKGEIKKIEKSE